MRVSFKISDICSEFLTRQSGKILREHMNHVLNRGDSVLVDLENQILTPSFADDAFGKIASDIGLEKFKDAISLKNIVPSSKSLIVHVVKRRSKEFSNTLSHHKVLTTTH